MNVAVLGYGIVGKGVVDIIDRMSDLDVVKIFSKTTMADQRYENTYSKVFADQKIEVVVEAMGGIHPAFEYVCQALEQGCHLVTSNKALVFAYGDYLHDLAKKHQRMFLFEASVGGAIPIIHTIMGLKSHENITSVYGILNGTTNYVLTKMTQENISFDAALNQAQQLGFAEKDTSEDIHGLDPARKIGIIANLLTQKKLTLDKINIQSLASITQSDIRLAKQHHCVIKYIAKLDIVDDKVSARVAPFFVHYQHPLATINGVDNAVILKGECISQITLVGQGAGRYPTASAVVTDVFNCQNYLPSQGWSDQEIETVVHPRTVMVIAPDQKARVQEISAEDHHLSGLWFDYLEVV